MRGLWVFAHAGGAFRDGRVEDVGVGTTRAQKAADAVAVLDDADGLFEGVAEATAQGRALEMAAIVEV